MTDEQFTKQADERHVVVATKMRREAAERLAKIAKKKGMTIYEIIQMVCDTLIRYMDDRHNMTEEMERAMSIFEHMVGWADALNLADPTVNKEVCQAVYIFQDGGDPNQQNKQRKKGFRATMISKPWMGKWEQDDNVMHIFERMFNILLPELYMKLYRAKIILGCNSITEVVNVLCDAEIIENMNEQFRQDFEDAARANNGRAVAYGAKTKAKQHRTPDSVADDQRYQQTHIIFDEDDKQLANMEAGYKPEDWEGEHHDRRE